MNLTWDQYFIKLAECAALKSKDPSTKIGAVIVGIDNEVLSIGFNGFPRGIADYSDRYTNRETKLKLIEHAERNAIYNAARQGIKLKDSKLYLSNNLKMICGDCAKAIIQSGISEVVGIKKADKELLKRWENDFSKTLFRESGITRTEIIYHA